MHRLKRNSPHPLYQHLPSSGAELRTKCPDVPSAGVQSRRWGALTTKGGHLILWEPRLVVEFPPGSLLLIPSATITNSNTPVAPNEARASFTQYAPGGLFRYVGYGFRLKGWAEKNKIQKAPLSHDASQAGQLEG
ncbi:hypothetical protein BJ912DRAFT_857245 [Pholiota molesta]|nr:hypothetical protein BJ912DRAFT_857245 [Pholiota molesta]